MSVTINVARYESTDLAITTAIGLRRSDRQETIGYLLKVSPEKNRIVTFGCVIQQHLTNREN